MCPEVKCNAEKSSFITSYICLSFWTSADLSLEGAPFLTQGVWRAAIYNPMRIYKLSYNLTASKEAHCLNGCNGHGTCSEDAVCHCEDNWTGGDCSVYASGASCQPGSRKPSPM